MKKLFLLGTALCVVTNVWAFGGIGIGKLQRHKNSGVDIIGIHIDPTKKKANIDFVDGDDTPQNTCPEERQCGDVCCGEGNVCDKETNMCCSWDYIWEGEKDMEMCCDTSVSLGFANNPWQCCTGGAVPRISYGDGYNEGEVECCMGQVYRATDDGDWYVHGCCEYNVYSNVGYQGKLDVCCDHEPIDYTNTRGETFKVCWDQDSECKTNEDCSKLGEGYFCNLSNIDTDQHMHPNIGVCEEIGDFKSASIGDLGTIIRSDSKMSWYAANNWCKAQGKTLVEIEDLNCYKDGETLITTNAGIEGYCCKMGNNCSEWDSWNPETLQNHSSVIVELVTAFGYDWMWTGSDFSAENYGHSYVIDGGNSHINDGNGRSDPGGWRALCK